MSEGETQQEKIDRIYKMVQKERPEVIVEGDESITAAQKRMIGAMMLLTGANNYVKFFPAREALARAYTAAGLAKRDEDVAKLIKDFGAAAYGPILEVLNKYPQLGGGRSR